MGALFPGLKGMLNYHPLFVHLPIGMWTAALLFELMSLAMRRETLHRTGCAVLALGALLAVPAVMSGWSAEAAVPATGAVHDVKETHENLMVTSSILSGILAAVGLFVLPRRPQASARAAFVAGLVLLAVLAAAGADRGAMLVYHYGTAVDWSAAQSQK